MSSCAPRRPIPDVQKPTLLPDAQCPFRWSRLLESMVAAAWQVRSKLRPSVRASSVCLRFQRPSIIPTTSTAATNHSQTIKIQLAIRATLKSILRNAASTVFPTTSTRPPPPSPTPPFGTSRRHPPSSQGALNNGVEDLAAWRGTISESFTYITTASTTVDDCLQHSTDESRDTESSAHSTICFEQSPSSFLPESVEN
jgi:hypothetical protein